MIHKKILLIVIGVITAWSFCYGIGERLWLHEDPPRGNYGMAYNPTNDRIYYCKYYDTHINIVSADSNCTSYGSIPTPNNDSNCVDIKYCGYDNTFWVLSKSTKRVYKITPTGSVLRWFSSPANDYPAGLAWDEENRELYLADRRSAGGVQGYIYCVDTLGNVIRQMNHPITSAWYGPRGLTWHPEVDGEGPFLLNVFTFFNSSSLLDSTGVFKLNPQDCAVLDFFRYCHPSNDSSNIRGVEFDPNTGDLWIDLLQYGT